AALMLCGGSALAFQVSMEYPASDRFLLNPFIGNAIWASDTTSEQPFTLVYANLTWAEFEPKKGVYDFESFEKANHFDRWRAEGKRLILRFVMDMPGSKKHMDIPGWLDKLTGKKGKAYNVSYGRGYLPNYKHPEMIAAHKRAIQALADRYDDDPFVAFVELGSLGHWGEWHIYYKLGSMPEEDVRDQYAQHYVDAFKRVKLMMRRPFNFAAKNNLGLFNDTAGEADATEKWLDWIASGGDYEDEEGGLSPMPDGWKVAPVGGELGSDTSAKRLLGRDFEQTMSLFERSHASWIGPHSFVESVEKDGPLQAALDRLLRTVGYRLRVSNAQLRVEDGEAALTVTLENDGNAPFYFGWDAVVRVTDGEGSERTYPLDVDLIEVLPDEPLTAEIALGALGPGENRVELAILDPDTGDPGVALAMDVPEDSGWYTLMSVSA
ncbi:MAG: DUF4832 domain-containing protein, partial [Lentisphaerae bacterium]|nr:DUF4832 domain-containing protein [Lentisphaerota bacterium]